MILTSYKGDKNKQHVEEWSKDHWNYFYNQEYLMYKIGYIVKGYEVIDDGNIDNGFLELYYNERRTLRQEWHT